MTFGDWGTTHIPTNLIKLGEGRTWYDPSMSR